MISPLNLYIATSVALFLLYRATVIVRESVMEAAPSTSGSTLPKAIVDGSLRAGGRLLVLSGTALAISCVIAIARETPEPSSARVEVVRLEPVVVSISAMRFDEIRAEEAGQTRLAKRASGKHAG